VIYTVTAYEIKGEMFYLDPPIDIEVFTDEDEYVATIDGKVATIDGKVAGHDKTLNGVLEKALIFCIKWGTYMQN